MAFLDLLSAGAQIVGGTKPSAGQSTVTADQLPYWYSGRDTGDSSGVAGLAGCWSVPPAVIGATPVGMVLPGPWRPDQTQAQWPMGGRKFSEDEVHVRVLVGHDAEQALIARLVNFRDTLPPVFDAHMALLNTPGVNTAWCNEGDFLEMTWGGNVYYALTFLVRVQRAFAVTYSA